MPVLLLAGGDGPDHLTTGPETVAAALPDARIVVIDHQQHVAHHQIPDQFAEHVLEFLRNDP